MNVISREQYVDVLNDRIQRDIIDICTRCGKCAEACPMIGPAEIPLTDAPSLVGGVLAILAGEPGTADSRRWVEVCSSSGSCVSACGDGVDPLFMMEMARVALKREHDAKTLQHNATRAFQRMAKSVRYLSRLFLDPQTLERLDPRASRVARLEPPEKIFYTGCNVLRTPHVALICLDILDRLNVTYEVMGGPSHCCGAYQMREGDTSAATGMAMNTIGKMVKAAAPEVISWCPSCQLQFRSVHLPTHAAAHEQKSSFDFTPFFMFMERRMADLGTILTRPVHRRVALDERPFDPAVIEAVKRVLLSIPGIEIVELDVPHIGMMSNTIPMPDFKKRLREQKFAAASAAGVTTFATIYHACHREVVSYSASVEFEIVNVMELIAESAGISFHDSFKEFQSVGDVDKYIQSQMHMVESHRISMEDLRTVALNEFAAHRPV
jgi:heterodisulfide reductase subunit D